MATPWEQIKDDGYRSWLISVPLKAEDFNAASAVERVTFRAQYDTLQRQQLPPPPPPPELRLFELVFDITDTGSSGIPHIHQNLEDFNMAQLKSLPMKESDKPLYRLFHQVEDEMEGKVFYSRELHVQVQLEAVVKDVIKSCKYKLKTDMEAALNGLRLDIWMLRRLNNVMCGTMEVKQPKRKNKPNDPDPMNHPKVVTQVLSQMIPLRTMYGVQKVYGILSTYSSWRFFRWVPEGEDLDGVKETGQLLEGLDVSGSPKKTAEGGGYFTPCKEQSESDAKKARKSPPMSPKPYCDDEGEEGNEEEDDSGDGASRGILYASKVVSDGPQALRMLAWVLGEMEHSPIHLVPAHQRDYLYVVQKDALGGYERLEHTPEHYKARMPRPNCGRLYVLEELGHRHHGRVYRAMSRNGNLCVLKYFVKSQSISKDDGNPREVEPKVAASMSVEYWNKAYEKWLPSARSGRWGGGDAIIMPDLEKMSREVDPQEVLPELKTTMKTRFFDLGLWHGDPAWRNVALVRNKAGALSKVCMIDLEPARMIEKTEASDWHFVEMWGEFEQRLKQDWKDFEAEDGGIP